MKRLVAIGFALGLATTASFALADVPNPTSTSTGTTSSSATGTGSGGGSSSSDGGGCSAVPGAARGSAALLLGLGMLFAIPLARRRNGATKK